MTEKNIPAISGGAVALLLFFTGVSTGWPAPVILLCLLCLVAGAVITIHRQNERQSEQERQHAMAADAHRMAQVQRAAEEAEEQQVAEEAAAPVLSSKELDRVALPSALPEFPLEFTCVAHWRATPDVPHADPGALAVESVLLRARAFASRVAPDDEVAGHLLASALGEVHRDGRDLVDVWATEVVLRAPEAERARLSQARTTHQEHHVWKRQVEVEREVRDYFEHDVLSSSGDALLWWLANNRNSVPKAVDVVEPLARLSSAVRGEQEVLGAEPVAAPEPAGFVVDADGEVSVVDLLPEPDEPGGTLFGAKSSDLLDALKHPERAERMRERYGLVDERETPEAPSDDAEDTPAEQVGNAPAEDALSGAGVNGHGPSANGASPNGSGPDGPSPGATGRD